MLHRPKILCVDDEPSVIESLHRLLRKDFEVLTASSGEEGLLVLKQNSDCAVILSDYRMPGINGIDFLKESKKIVSQAVRAILSGQIDIAQLADAINSAEIHRFILKPWDNELLKLQMLEALQSHNTIKEKNKYKNLSITDPVTQLTNHRYFQERLIVEFEESKKNNEPLSVVMVDVDHFKSYNDRYGHPEGDRLLANVGSRMSEYFPIRGMASRYGGEEFVVILPNTNWQKAFEQADTLRQSLESSPFAGPLNRPCYVTISVGVATFPDHAQSAAELVKAADDAMYEAKKRGRNQTVLAG